MENRKILVGVRREDKSYWERRTPLPPDTCKEIMEQVKQHYFLLFLKHPKIQIIVQPSTKRIFPNNLYQKAGCIIQEDLSECVLIVCIKEIPPEKFIEGKTYLFWSHTIKGQEQNMPALDAMIEKKVRHLDYEKILNEGGVNITAFPFAGITGVITFLNEYGKFLLQKSINSPFLSIGPAYQYYNKELAYKSIRDAGELIQMNGIPDECDLPLILGVLGSTGKCGRGSMETLQNLPITIIEPNQMKELVADKHNEKHKYTIYVVPLQTKHLVRNEEDFDQEVNSKDFYDNPNHFVPIFHSKYLPYISLLVNDIYWETKFPRYITNSQMKDLVQSGKSRLQAVCDVTCDIEGAIQFLKKYTTPEKPCYYYDPITEKIHEEFTDNTIMYMAIDFLPSQLPYDASLAFGNLLKKIVPEIAYSNPDKPLEESGLPQYLQNATITLHGSLTKRFEYITKLRKMNEQLKAKQNFQPKKALKKVPSYTAVKLIGNLFDTAAINKMLDALEGVVKFNLVNINIGQSNKEHSHATIQLFSKQSGSMMEAIETLSNIAKATNIQVLVEH